MQQYIQDERKQALSNECAVVHEALLGKLIIQSVVDLKNNVEASKVFTESNTSD